MRLTPTRVFLCTPRVKCFFYIGMGDSPLHTGAVLALVSNRGGTDKISGFALAY